MMNTPSPCLLCTRVADPKNCENKQCVLWRNWFTAKWNHTRKLFDRKPTQPDPCLDCPWNGPLCTTPCPGKEAYEREVCL